VEEELRAKRREEKKEKGGLRA
jgi:hypothetical protein